MNLKIIIALAVFAFTINARAQQDRVDFSNPDLTTGDIIASLEMLDIEVHKYGVTLPGNAKYNITLFIDEYDSNGKLKSNKVWSTSSPYLKEKNEELIDQVFDGVRIISKNNETEFVLNMRMGNFSVSNYLVEIDSIYSKPHGVKRFQIESNLLNEGKTPLLMIGSFWEEILPEGRTFPDGSNKIMRFCMENELNPDLSSEAFKEMPHYFLVGIDVEKQ